MNQINKWERRDNKRNAQRRMRVDGAGTKTLQRIILEKADKIKNNQTRTV